MRIRLVLVDDHDGFRRLAAATLDGDHFEVVGEAATAGSAVQVASALRPSLVLLDIALPDGDGFEVADRLARLDSPPVVVLISSRHRDDYGRRLERPSVAGFLSKDQLTVEALLDLLGTRP
jgi:DNA-binding NarL/FixJ family response regulator